MSRYIIAYKKSQPGTSFEYIGVMEMKLAEYPTWQDIYEKLAKESDYQRNLYEILAISLSPRNARFK